MRLYKRGETGAIFKPLSSSESLYFKLLSSSESLISPQAICALEEKMPDANPTADKEQGSFWNLRWRDSRSKWISGCDFDSGTPEARAPMQRTLTLLDIPKSTDPFRAALVAQKSDLPSFPDDFRDLTGKNVGNAGDISLKVHLSKFNLESCVL